MTGSGFPVSLPLCTGVAVYALLLALGARLLNDPDVYWHIAVGRWIVEHRAFPHVDTFSATVAGAPWIAKEWVSQLLLAGAHAVAGWSGVVIIAAFAIACAFALLAYFLLRKLAPVPALTLLCAGFVLASTHFLARPHALALPLMVVWAGVLINAVDHRRAPPFALIPVMTLWANLHGSFTLGLALVAPLAVEAWWNAGEARRETALRWIGFAILALIAACLTPYGWEPILVAWRILGLGQVLSIISEWRPQDFSRIGGFEMCLLLGLGFALYRGIVLPPLRIAMLIGLLHLALSQARHADVFGLLAPLLLAQPLARQLGAAEASGASSSRQSSGLARAAAAASLIGLTFAFASTSKWAPRAQISPVAAVAAIKAHNAEPLLNDYDFGGYLIYAGVKPFIDGRTDQLYGEAFMVRHERAVMLQNVGDFVRLLDDYGINATLLNRATPAVGLLDRMGEWQRVYADDIAVVHVRRAPVR
ncbi:MAG: hypothetical protein JO328_12140 [Hyphomicrobiales bacterium]|nr:hypothetical protein [Hyphomicrobiales bacterium]MBV8826106.1 hypothetical protein [Hyphomicrobiales bacterium]MBV9429195.1 hypothetical protein [Bradyrhizobiaceae bacterium]